MKTITLFMALSIGLIMSCQKSNDEELVSKPAAKSAPTTKTGSTDDPVEVPPIFMSKSVAIADLITNGFVEVETLPVDLPALLTASPAPSSVTVYVKDIDGFLLYARLYSFANSAQAAAAAGGNDCTQDWQADKDLEACHKSGNECKVGAIDTVKGTVEIICCD